MSYRWAPALLTVAACHDLEQFAIDIARLEGITRGRGIVPRPRRHVVGARPVVDRAGRGGDQDKEEMNG